LPYLVQRYEKVEGTHGGKVIDSRLAKALLIEKEEMLTATEKTGFNQSAEAIINAKLANIENLEGEVIFVIGKPDAKQLELMMKGKKDGGKVLGVFVGEAGEWEGYGKKIDQLRLNDPHKIIRVVRIGRGNTTATAWSSLRGRKVFAEVFGETNDWKPVGSRFSPRRLISRKVEITATEPITASPVLSHRLKLEMQLDRLKKLQEKRQDSKVPEEVKDTHEVLGRLAARFDSNKQAKFESFLTVVHICFEEAPKEITKKPDAATLKKLFDAAQKIWPTGGRNNLGQRKEKVPSGDVLWAALEPYREIQLNVKAEERNKSLKKSLLFGDEAVLQNDIAFLEKQLLGVLPPTPTSTTQFGNVHLARDLNHLPLPPTDLIPHRGIANAITNTVVGGQALRFSFLHEGSFHDCAVHAIRAVVGRNRATPEAIANALLRFEWSALRDVGVHTEVLRRIGTETTEEDVLANLQGYADRIKGALQSIRSDDRNTAIRDAFETMRDVTQLPANLVGRINTALEDMGTQGLNPAVLNELNAIRREYNNRVDANWRAAFDADINSITAEVVNHLKKPLEGHYTQAMINRLWGAAGTDPEVFVQRILGIPGGTTRLVEALTSTGGLIPRGMEALQEVINDVPRGPERQRLEQLRLRAQNRALSNAERREFFEAFLRNRHNSRVVQDDRRFNDHIQMLLTFPADHGMTPDQLQMRFYQRMIGLMPALQGNREHLEVLWNVRQAAYNRYQELRNDPRRGIDPVRLERLLSDRWVNDEYLRQFQGVSGDGMNYEQALALYRYLLGNEGVPQAFEEVHIGLEKGRLVWHTGLDRQLNQAEQVMWLEEAHRRGEAIFVNRLGHDVTYIPMRGGGWVLYDSLLNGASRVENRGVWFANSQELLTHRGYGLAAALPIAGRAPRLARLPIPAYHGVQLEVDAHTFGPRFTPLRTSTVGATTHALSMRRSKSTSKKKVSNQRFMDRIYGTEEDNEEEEAVIEPSGPRVLGKALSTHSGSSNEDMNEFWARVIKDTGKLTNPTHEKPGKDRFEAMIKWLDAMKFDLSDPLTRALLGKYAETDNIEGLATELRDAYAKQRITRLGERLNFALKDIETAFESTVWGDDQENLLEAWRDLCAEIGNRTRDDDLNNWIRNQLIRLSEKIIDHEDTPDELKAKLQFAINNNWFRWQMQGGYATAKEWWNHGEMRANQLAGTYWYHAIESYFQMHQLDFQFLGFDRFIKLLVLVQPESSKVLAKTRGLGSDLNTSEARLLMEVLTGYSLRQLDATDAIDEIEIQAVSGVPNVTTWTEKFKAIFNKKEWSHAQIYGIRNFSTDIAAGYNRELDTVDADGVARSATIRVDERYVLSNEAIDKDDEEHQIVNRIIGDLTNQANERNGKYIKLDPKVYKKQDNYVRRFSEKRSLDDNLKELLAYSKAKLSILMKKYAEEHATADESAIKNNVFKDAVFLIALIDIVATGRSRIKQDFDLLSDREKKEILGTKQELIDLLSDGVNKEALVKYVHHYIGTRRSKKKGLTEEHIQFFAKLANALHEFSELELKDHSLVRALYQKNRRGNAFSRGFKKVGKTTPFINSLNTLKARRFDEGGYPFLVQSVWDKLEANERSKLLPDSVGPQESTTSSSTTSHDKHERTTPVPSVHDPKEPRTIPVIELRTQEEVLESVNNSLSALPGKPESLDGVQAGADYLSAVKKYLDHQINYYIKNPEGRVTNGYFDHENGRVQGAIGYARATLARNRIATFVDRMNRMIEALPAECKAGYEGQFKAIRDRALGFSDEALNARTQELRTLAEAVITQLGPDHEFSKQLEQANENRWYRWEMGDDVVRIDNTRGWWEPNEEGLPIRLNIEKDYFVFETYLQSYEDHDFEFFGYDRYMALKELIISHSRKQLDADTLMKSMLEAATGLGVKKHDEGKSVIEIARPDNRKRIYRGGLLGFMKVEVKGNPNNRYGRLISVPRVGKDLIHNQPLSYEGQPLDSAIKATIVDKQEALKHKAFDNILGKEWLDKYLFMAFQNSKRRLYRDVYAELQRDKEDGIEEGGEKDRLVSRVLARPLEDNLSELLTHAELRLVEVALMYHSEFGKYGDRSNVFQYRLKRAYLYLAALVETLKAEQIDKQLLQNLLYGRVPLNEFMQQLRGESWKKYVVAMLTEKAGRHDPHASMMVVEQFLRQEGVLEFEPESERRTIMDSAAEESAKWTVKDMDYDATQALAYREFDPQEEHQTKINDKLYGLNHIGLVFYQDYYAATKVENFMPRYYYQSGVIGNRPLEMGDKHYSAFIHGLGEQLYAAKPETLPAIHENRVLESQSRLEFCLDSFKQWLVFSHNETVLNRQLTVLKELEQFKAVIKAFKEYAISGGEAVEAKINEYADHLVKYMGSLLPESAGSDAEFKMRGLKQELIRVIYEARSSDSDSEKEPLGSRRIKSKSGTAPLTLEEGEATDISDVIIISTPHTVIPRTPESEEDTSTWNPWHHLQPKKARIPKPLVGNERGLERYNLVLDHLDRIKIQVANDDALVPDDERAKNIMMFEIMHGRYDRESGQSNGLVGNIRKRMARAELSTLATALSNVIREMGPIYGRRHEGENRINEWRAFRNEILQQNTDEYLQSWVGTKLRVLTEHTIRELNDGSEDPQQNKLVNQLRDALREEWWIGKAQRDIEVQKLAWYRDLVSTLKANLGNDIRPLHFDVFVKLLAYIRSENRDEMTSGQFGINAKLRDRPIIARMAEFLTGYEEKGINDNAMPTDRLILLGDQGGHNRGRELRESSQRLNVRNELEIKTDRFVKERAVVEKFLAEPIDKALVSLNQYAEYALGDYIGQYIVRNNIDPRSALPVLMLVEVLGATPHADLNKCDMVKRLLEGAVTGEEVVNCIRNGTRWKEIFINSGGTEARLKSFIEWSERYLGYILKGPFVCDDLAIALTAGNDRVPARFGRHFHAPADKEQTIELRWKDTFITGKGHGFSIDQGNFAVFMETLRYRLEKANAETIRTVNTIETEHNPFADATAGVRFYIDSIADYMNDLASRGVVATDAEKQWIRDLRLLTDNPRRRGGANPIAIDHQYDYIERTILEYVSHGEASKLNERRQKVVDVLDEVLRPLLEGTDDSIIYDALMSVVMGDRVPWSMMRPVTPTPPPSPVVHPLVITPTPVVHPVITPVVHPVIPLPVIPHALGGVLAPAPLKKAKWVIDITKNHPMVVEYIRDAKGVVTRVIREPLPEELAQINSGAIPWMASEAAVVLGQESLLSGNAPAALKAASASSSAGTENGYTTFCGWIAMRHAGLNVTHEEYNAALRAYARDVARYFNLSGDVHAGLIEDYITNRHNAGYTWFAILHRVALERGYTLKGLHTDVSRAGVRGTLLRDIRRDGGLEQWMTTRSNGTHGYMDTAILRITGKGCKTGDGGIQRGVNENWYFFGVDGRRYTVSGAGHFVTLKRAKAQEHFNAAGGALLRLHGGLPVINPDAAGAALNGVLMPNLLAGHKLDDRGAPIVNPHWLAAAGVAVGTPAAVLAARAAGIRDEFYYLMEGQKLDERGWPIPNNHGLGAAASPDLFYVQECYQVGANGQPLPNPNHNPATDPDHERWLKKWYYLDPLFAESAGGPIEVNLDRLSRDLPLLQIAAFNEQVEPTRPRVRDVLARELDWQRLGRPAMGVAGGGVPGGRAPYTSPYLASLPAVARHFRLLGNPYDRLIRAYVSGCALANVASGRPARDSSQRIADHVGKTLGQVESLLDWLIKGIDKLEEMRKEQKSLFDSIGLTKTRSGIPYVKQIPRHIFLWFKKWPKDVRVVIFDDGISADGLRYDRELKAWAAMFAQTLQRRAQESISDSRRIFIEFGRTDQRQRLLTEADQKKIQAMVDGKSK